MFALVFDAAGGRVKMQTVRVLTDYLALDDGDDDNNNNNEAKRLPQAKRHVNRKRDGNTFEVVCSNSDLDGLVDLADDLASSAVEYDDDEIDALKQALENLSSIVALPITAKDRAIEKDDADPHVLHIPVPPQADGVRNDLYTSKNVAGFIMKQCGIVLKSMGLVDPIRNYVNMQVVKGRDSERPRRVFLNFSQKMHADDVATVRRALDGIVWLDRVFGRPAEGQELQGITYYVRCNFKTPAGAK
jgi:hypothetical protein